MTDKVQKIREKVVEIVNRINLFIPDEDGKNSDYEAGKLDAATQILQIIDSLEEPVSEDLEEASVNYAATGEFLPNGKEMIDFQLEKAFRAGAKWQSDRVTEALLSEVLPCFMHGGEADEVVAKLEEVLNQKK